MMVILLSQNHYEHATFLIQKFVDSADQNIMTSPFFWNVIFKYYVRPGRLNELNVCVFILFLFVFLFCFVCFGLFVCFSFLFFFLV
jgi:hypothetical protein